MKKYYILGAVIVGLVLSAVNQKRREIEKEKELKIIDETVKSVFSPESLDKIREKNRVFIEDFVL